MTIVDAWDNPVTLGESTLIGYRGNFIQFPHDIYSFFLSTIREDDESDVGLLYRWTRPMQLLWEEIYGQILDLPNLLSPDKCEYKYLEYLRKKVGIIDEFNYLWGVLDESEKRSLIKYFIRFLQYRCTSLGIIEMMEAMSGQASTYLNYFYYRWILSGDLSNETECAIGRDDTGHDMWLLSEDTIPVGVTPNIVYARALPGSTTIRYYLFIVDELINQIGVIPSPPIINIACKLTGYMYSCVVTYGTLYDDNGNPFDCYYSQLPLDYFFHMEDDALSIEPTDFQVSFEPDNYVSDILVTDEGDLNRDMIHSIVQFQRPISERIYIRYYKLIELFESLNKWTTVSGTVLLDSDEHTVLLSDAAADTNLLYDYLDCLDWRNYTFDIKCQCGIVDKYSEIRFMYQSDLDYYFIRFTPAEPPTIPAGVLVFGTVVGGVSSILSTVYLDWMDIDVDYLWRVECFYQLRSTGPVQIIRIYQDENLLIEYIDDPPSWMDLKGTIEIVEETGGQLLVSKVFVRSVYGDLGDLTDDYVGAYRKSHVVLGGGIQ